MPLNTDIQRAIIVVILARPGNTFPLDRVMLSQAHTYWNCSEGTDSAQGRWAKGPTYDGQGEFQYLASPEPLTSDTGEAPPADPRLHGTEKMPMPPVSVGPNPRSDQASSTEGN